MADNKEAIIRRIMIEFSKTIEMFDLNPLEARLFAHLYLAEKPMTLDEMSEALGKSKTAMSTNIRSLSELNLVTRVWKKGVRKDLYQANRQLFKLFTTSYMNKWIDAAAHQRDTIKEIENEAIKQLDETPNDRELKKLEEQLSSILVFHEEVVAFFRNKK
ncbi:MULTISPECIES: MarR family transcriptional regulator [unclassified Virgibacillus]|uniref:GbsR/MarR family transcriptional regulator n=1 Tax=unclassified Virgibacillus TaxID=2620237 RepID=UPI0024DE2675|nr:MarR family transcriptional regulator [Virgibacillus sp. LDC-1]